MSSKLSDIYFPPNCHISGIFFLNLRILAEKQKRKTSGRQAVLFRRIRQRETRAQTKQK